MRVSRDHAALLAARPGAEAIDLTFELRIDLDRRVAQRLARDEIVGQLVERPIEMVVRLGIT
jgi:hypothetical protein